VSAPKTETRPGKYDSARRRRSKRAGRERGCWLYVPGEELNKAGFNGHDPPPFYRIWAGTRGGLFVRLYKEG